ncbi:hypothetical protein ADUPG1_012134, partial [Aduncisulcus paluster]
MIILTALQEESIMLQASKWQNGSLQEKREVYDAVRVILDNPGLRSQQIGQMMRRLIDKQPIPALITPPPNIHAKTLGRTKRITLKLGSPCSFCKCKLFKGERCICAEAVVKKLDVSIAESIKSILFPPPLPDVISRVSSKYLRKRNSFFALGHRFSKILRMPRGFDHLHGTITSGLRRRNAELPLSIVVSLQDDARHTTKEGVVALTTENRIESLCWSEVRDVAIVAGIGSERGQHVPLIWGDPFTEPLLFPLLFPYGTKKYSKDCLLSLTQYAKTRVMQSDPRFLSSLGSDYFLTLWDALFRQRVFSSPIIRSVQQGRLEQGGRLTRRLGCNIPFTIPGSNGFWKKKYLDLLAIVECLGEPQYFLTLTVNDAWEELKTESHIPPIFNPSLYS